VISGPSDQLKAPPGLTAEPPGEFVSDELREDCARFLDELRTQLTRREEARDENGWVPAARRP
jgi:hypothetical protein